MRSKRKYGNNKEKIDGHIFDSKMEARRYLFLRRLAIRGRILNLIIHPRFVIFAGYVHPHTGKKIAPVTYSADFQYEFDGKTIVEDVKGVETETFRIKWKMVQDLYRTFHFQKITSRDKGAF